MRPARSAFPIMHIPRRRPPDGSTSNNEEALPTPEEVMSLRRPTLKHIPKGARQKFGKIFYDCLSQVVSENDETAWTKLLMLPKCVLPSNKRAGRKKTLPSIESFCDRWERGNWSTLWVPPLLVPRRWRLLWN